MLRLVSFDSVATSAGRGIPEQLESFLARERRVQARGCYDLQSVSTSPLRLFVCIWGGQTKNGRARNRVWTHNDGEDWGIFHLALVFAIRHVVCFLVSASLSRFSARVSGQATRCKREHVVLFLFVEQLRKIKKAGSARLARD